MNNKYNYIKEPFENYEELTLKVKKLGDITKIINDKNKMIDVLTYSGNKFFLVAFFDEVSRKIANGTIKDEDLMLFRSGWLVKQILNLEKLVKQKGRFLYYYEIGDKLNYISLIKDFDTVNANYTNPILIKKIINNPYNSELRYWLTSGSIYMILPFEIQRNIAISFHKYGGLEIASRILDTAVANRKRLSNLKKSEEEFMKKINKNFISY